MTEHGTGRPGTSAHRRTRWGRVLVLAALLAGGLVACRPPADGCEPGAGPPDIPRHSPWAGRLCRQANQQPPVSVNGVVYRDGVLWIASLDGGEIVAADADTGEILGRFGPDQGVTSAPDDLAMTRHGTIYWSGFTSGDVGVLQPDGTSSTLVNVGPGVNPVVLGPDHELYVARFWDGAGLYRIDRRDGTATVVNPDVEINAFGFGPDGQIYAPTMEPLPSQLLRIDPATGVATAVPADLGLASSSVRFPPPSRGEAPTTAYALSPLPPALVRRIDSTTGQPTGPDIDLPIELADNITFAPDGRMFATGFNSPVVAIVAVDGSTRTIPIGTP